MEQINDGDVVMEGSAEPIPVPSGQPVTLQDVVWSMAPFEGSRLRFRFVAPEIRVGGTVDFSQASADMMALCQGYAREKMTTLGETPAQIIVSMAEKPVVFGETLPEVVQFFEAFQIDGNICILEIY